MGPEENLTIPKLIDVRIVASKSRVEVGSLNKFVCWWETLSFFICPLPPPPFWSLGHNLKGHKHEIFERGFFLHKQELYEWVI